MYSKSIHKKLANTKFLEVTSTRFGKFIEKLVTDLIFASSKRRNSKICKLKLLLPKITTLETQRFQREFKKQYCISSAH